MNEWIKEYQCPGCINYPEECYKPKIDGIECENHLPATRQLHVGLLFLGLPKGFCRLGVFKKMTLEIFTKFNPENYDKYNIPVWKYKNKNNHVLVRGLMPRINQPFLHIYLVDCLNKINCLELSHDDITSMD